ncbi:hypothetical protein GBAR_LOCUS26534 [Geodia barretti]|uniref:Uncharacterized protein n=1 Tax=Geodia barretti TaxID=519541 RepID=A0AA35XD50_GEOBA|nr:hypothetical protein GBAR_LOCUS26534 [Geodia barretti]
MPQSTVIPQPDTLPNTDQNVPRQSQTEPQLVPLQDQAQPTTNQTHTTASDDIYENVVIAPKPHSACDLTLPEAGSETESALPVTSSEFKVILKPRVPRDRPSSQSPPGEQDEMARPPSPQSLLLPKLPQSPVKLQHPAHTYDLTPHVPSSTTPQPDYEVVATPGLDEFGMMHFRATREEANPQRTVHMEEHTNVAVPDPSPLNEQEVPTQNVFPQYINVASPGPQLPLLPDDLLALLDNPTASPQLDQVQGQSTYNGAPLSPLSSPQLATQLLTLPEQLLNMIQPVPDETIQPKATDNENAPLLSPTEGPEYVNFSQNRENEESYVEISPFHEGSQSEQSDYVEVASPPQEETPFEYLPMSPFHEEIQPEYVEVTHQQNEAEEQTADDYVPMSPPPHTSLADYVEVEPARQREPSSVPAAPRPRVTSKESEYEIPLLQDMDQQEYEGVPSGAQATATAEQAQANEAPMFLPLLPPPEVVATLPQARAPEEENYETIPAAAREEDDTTEHIYEPLPPPRSPPTPEEPDQPMYIDVPDPLPTSPPPVLPPRSQSEPPEPRLNQEPAPPVPPRPSSQAIAPPGTAPQDQNQEAPVVRETIPAPATDAVPAQPPETEIINQTEDGVAALNQVLQELQQGNALELTESMPPQYDDLSQTPRYIDLVQSPAVQQNPLQAAPSPHGQAYIIQNINTNTATRGPIRAENVDIHYEMGDRQHHRNKNMKKTQTLLWLSLSILAAVLWMLLVVPLSAAALLDALKEVEADRAPLVPSCHYSVPLLLVVLLTHVLAAAFIVYWFSKCCKCARTKKASRLATQMTAIIATVYTVVIISFAVSVFLFVNKATNSSNEESTTTQTTVTTMATTATDSNNDNESEVCIETSSAPFLFATFYLLALLIFFAMAVLMTCCDYHYKRKERNFLLYLRDTVRVYENEGREEDEETAL